MASGFPDWLRAFSMLGKYGDDFVVVAVTEAGNLYTLLQGETVDEELRTVRLDDQGRLSAFVIDSIDAWGAMLSIGNAELAARLGSVVRYERTGEVQFIETFESGLQTWTTATQGTGAAVVLSPVSASSGGYSVKLTGGSDGVRTAHLLFERGLLPQGKQGLAVSFALPGTIDYLDVKMATYDGTTARTAAARFTDTNDDLEYLDSDGNYQKLADVGLTSRDAANYNRIKLVADFANGIYLRCLFNQVSYDMSAYAIYSRASAVAPAIFCDIMLGSRDGENDIAYIDDVVVTVAEPT